MAKSAAAQKIQKASNMKQPKKVSNKSETISLNKAANKGSTPVKKAPIVGEVNGGNSGQL